LMNAFLKEIKNNDVEDEFQPFHLMHILSDIIEYEEQLEQLDKMIRSYQKFHLKKL